ncbi:MULTISPECIES: hypothetical protein [unclassified Rhizobium]|uniref:hypothetical protein n=1 Tax=unclassified Rhizobium TaxID=2613769 RepID=UPI000EAAA527|nr:MULTISPECIES: hypothetical protein [unclassified Rhizobium]AYG70039.1 hypothetical protein CCGE531_28700 [Rhizobium sp. CCGE531]AYG76415.1 hypothetical protein CCGE532_28175 [Rhizobium sp. CCGE532]
MGQSVVKLDTMGIWINDPIYQIPACCEQLLKRYFLYHQALEVLSKLLFDILLAPAWNRGNRAVMTDEIYDIARSICSNVNSRPICVLNSGNLHTYLVLSDSVLSILRR